MKEAGYLKHERDDLKSIKTNLNIKNTFGLHKIVFRIPAFRILLLTFVTFLGYPSKGHKLTNNLMFIQRDSYNDSTRYKYETTVVVTLKKRKVILENRNKNYVFRNFDKLDKFVKEDLKKKSVDKAIIVLKCDSCISRFKIVKDIFIKNEYVWLNIKSK